MKIENDYPKIKKKYNKFLKFRKILLLLFSLSVIVCTIVNLSVGGKKWMLYVIGAEIIFYFAFLDKPLIDNALVKKITVLVLVICSYLYVIDLINDTSWSYFVITIVSFSMITFQLILFLSEVKLQRKKFMPLFLTSIGSVILCILALSRVVSINWPVIVLGSLGLLSLILLFTFFRKGVIFELRKYFSLK